MKRLAGLCALTLLAAACGSVSDDGGGGGGPDAGAGTNTDGGDGPDTTAPTILSMSPADGATGIAADASRDRVAPPRKNSRTRLWP